MHQCIIGAGPSQEGGWGGCSPPQFLAEQLTLSQPGGVDYARHSTTSLPGFSDLVTALRGVILWHPQILADQLTLSQGRQIMPAK